MKTIIGYMVLQILDGNPGDFGSDTYGSCCYCGEKCLLQLNPCFFYANGLIRKFYEIRDSKIFRRFERLLNRLTDILKRTFMYI